uniref:Uncharacterized protein n=1 Tax=Glossina pallidipes TaxID=7398 RepID=A0A1A9ZX29_GLOPL
MRANKIFLTVSVTITPTTRGVIMGIKLTVVLAIPISMPAWLGDKSIVFNVQPIIVPLLRPTNRVIRSGFEVSALVIATTATPTFKRAMYATTMSKNNSRVCKWRIPSLGPKNMRSFESDLIRVVNSMETDVTCTTLLGKRYKKLTVSLTITPTTNGVIRGIKLPKALLMPISTPA